MQFESLNIVEPILKSLKEEGYTTPTPIQAQAIPIILQGKDLTCTVVFGGVNQNPQTNELCKGITAQRFNKSAA